MRCLEMKGTDCSVKTFELLNEEEYDQGLVQRSQYEYMPTGKFLIMAQKRRKSSALVCKELHQRNLLPPSQASQEIFTPLLHDQMAILPA